MPVPRRVPAPVRGRGGDGDPARADFLAQRRPGSAGPHRRMLGPQAGRGGGEARVVVRLGLRAGTPDPLPPAWCSVRLRRRQCTPRLQRCRFMSGAISRRLDLVADLCQRRLHGILRRGGAALDLPLHGLGTLGGARLQLARVAAQQRARLLAGLRRVPQRRARANCSSRAATIVSCAAVCSGSCAMMDAPPWLFQLLRAAGGTVLLPAATGAGGVSGRCPRGCWRPRHGPPSPRCGCRGGRRASPPPC